MDMKWEQGDWALGPTGLPETVEGLEELLQNGAMAIAMEQGSLPYDRSLGSRFTCGTGRRSTPWSGQWPWPTRGCCPCRGCRRFPLRRRKTGWCSP